jgi:DNA repair exonuclease SbcCD nuclease subunit
MKIALITDTHFGALQDSKTFLDYAFKFFDTQFFPYLKEHNITQVVHLGDWNDRHKYSNNYTLYAVRTRLVEKMQEMGLTMHLLAGNHDLFLKNTSDVCSSVEIS